jgi:tyrosyl-tRNA synthetase
MNNLKPHLYRELTARGLINQVTDQQLATKLDRDPLTLYCGFDPTADSLHIGSLLPLLTLRRFQDHGHRPIAVVGGSTGMIGDPSGKSNERQLLDNEQLAKNLAGIRAVISRFLDCDGPQGARIVNNGDWFNNIRAIDFLRDVGKHFTINHMVAKESVRSRLEDPDRGISYTEFSYMLLQAYDFHYLHREHSCTLQIGGSDQWGNITAGCELIRRTHAAHQPSQSTPPAVYGLTFPLITKSDGTKFGKSESGTVWLDKKYTSPYAFYQFFIRSADQDVIKLLKYLTFVSLEEIAALETAVTQEPEKRLAQRRLAEEMCRFVHGEEELRKVQMASQALFGTEIRHLSKETLREILHDAPTTTLSRESLADGMPLIDILANAQILPSKGAARKEIAGGGIYVNN